MLQCAVDDEFDYFYEVNDLTTLEKPCVCDSCHREIKKGEVAREVECFFINEDGEEESSLNKYYCEKCDEILGTLASIGYTTVYDGQNAQDLLEEYWKLTGFDPKKWQSE